MTRITRQELLAGIMTVKTIQSATWKRRVDKKNKQGNIIARAGDIVTMQFLPRIKNGTKNWTPKGGYCFGVATKQQADKIKFDKGLLAVLKMSENNTNDTKAVPRTIPLNDIETWKAEGIEYVVVD